MQSALEQDGSLKKRVLEQIKTRKKIISDFLKDLSLKEKQITTSKKTGINENTITRMKKNHDFVTSLDNAIALYSVYPELNKRFLNQWIEVSGLQSINEYEVQVNGSITKINSSNDIKVPHMGWNKVKHLGDHFLLRDIPDESSFYFVHSYCCLESVDAITETTHGNKFISALAKDNIFAVQFHPEKSQNSGLQLYKNFLDWSI